MIFIVIYFILVFIHSAIRLYLYPLYFDLTQREKIEKHYLTWTENFNYQHSIWIIKTGHSLLNREIINYRFDIQLLGLYRALFKKLDFKKKKLEYQNMTSDLNAMDCSEFFKLRKNGKI